jgi:hypothetical protein
MPLDQPRSTPRFHPDTPLPATFTINGAPGPVGLRDLSVTGAQIEHTVPIRPATAGTLKIESFSARATVIWSRLAAPGIYRSGLRIHEDLDLVAAKIRELLGRGIVKKHAGDAAARQREAQLARQKASALLVRPLPRSTGPSDQQILLIRQAREQLLMHPEDSVKWYNRARATATEDHIRIAESGRPNREDVLAVWEYLERSVDLRHVVQALS